MLTIIISISNFVKAQTTVTTSGGDASGAGGSVSYSVGQIVYSTNAGSNGSVAEGVQQPYEISVVTENNNFPDVSIECLAYPNPASDNLILSVEETDIEFLSYLLYDNNGKLIEKMKITSDKSSISMNLLAPGPYYLKVLANETEIKIFKIIKN